MKTDNSAPIILDSIPFHTDLVALFKKLHIDPGSKNADSIKSLASEALLIARPRALYTVAPFSPSFHEFIVDLPEDIGPPSLIFPFIASCGPELEEWSNSISDSFLNFCSMEIAAFALECAVSAFRKDIKQFHGGHVLILSPGSLPSWPLDSQKDLFALLGSPGTSIGVSLTDSFMMIPVKSISGIAFPSDKEVHNCHLCSLDNCEYRTDNNN
ncbi:MAG: hypothetical protein GY754_42060 [bacterium]|nr:hypothetical protein [bacterium]